MAHKKGAGSSNNGRESESKRLGVKIFGGQKAIAGNIIIRNVEPNIIPVTTSEWVKITRYLHSLMGWFNSKKVGKTDLTFTLKL